MEHKDITEKIIGCAYQVYNKMGFGFLESVYEKCLLLELRRAGLKVEVKRKIRQLTNCGTVDLRDKNI